MKAKTHPFESSTRASLPGILPLIAAALTLAGCVQFNHGGSPGALSGGGNGGAGGGGGGGGGGAGGGGGSVPAASLTVNLPDPVGPEIGEHDVGARTITFTHDGDEEECSHDGGATWGACDAAGTLIFTPEDYADGDTLMIRVRAAGGDWTEESVDPADLWPGLTFTACDETVTADESFDAFQARFDANGKVRALRGRRGERETLGERYPSAFRGRRGPGL